MTNMNVRNKGFIKMSLAHHPLCYFYRNDIIRLPFFRNYPLCLGCFGVYSGILLMLLVLFLGFFHPNWNLAVILSLLFLVPTCIRFILIIPKKMKMLRLLTRLLLGFAIGIGLYSLTIVPNILLLVLQLLLGIVIYILLAIQRTRNPYPECLPCIYNPSKACPGLSPFFNLYELLYGSEYDSFDLNMLKPKHKPE